MEVELKLRNSYLKIVKKLYNKLNAKFNDMKDVLIIESKEDILKFKNWIKDNTSREFIVDDDKEMYANSLVDNFIFLKPKIKSPYNDLYYWMKHSNPDELSKYVDDLLKQHREKVALKDKEKEGAELIYSDDTWKVYHITNYEASAKYGKGTKWCITGTKRWNDGENGKETFQDYHENNHVEFYFFIKNNGEKYALAMYPNGDAYEIFNAEDVSVGYIPDAPKVDGLPDISQKDDRKILINAIASDKLSDDIILNAIESVANYNDSEDYDLIFALSPETVSSIMKDFIPECYLEYNAVATGRMTPEEYHEITGDTITDLDVENGYTWGGDIPEVVVDEDKFTTREEACDPKNYQGHKYWYFFEDRNSWNPYDLYWADDKVGLYNSLRQLLGFDSMYSFLEAVADEILHLVRVGEIDKKELSGLGLFEESLSKNINEDEKVSQNAQNQHSLTKEQEEFFKDSVIRDKSGKLIPMWHGTNVKFNNFNGKINWFTKDKDYAREYATWLGGTPIYYEAYLNCKKLFNVGDTSARVFDLAISNPLKLSRESLAIIRRLGIDEEDFRRLVGMTSAGSDAKEQYKLKMHTITRLGEFAELVKAKGYDSIYALENGHQCVGVLNPQDIKKVTNEKPTNSANIDEDVKHDWDDENKIIAAAYRIGAKEGISYDGPTLLMPNGTCLNVENCDTHGEATALIGSKLGYKFSDYDDEEEYLDYLEHRLGVITLNGGNWDYEDRCKIVIAGSNNKPTEAQYYKMREFLDDHMRDKDIYVYAKNQFQTYNPFEYTSDDIIKKIRRAFAFGRLEEDKAITWGDLDFAKKTDTRKMMGGRGTGHFGTGFYFVGQNGKYGIKDGKLQYDYEPSRPIYEIDLDKYNLYRPTDNDSAYKLHDALRNINNDYWPNLDSWLFKDIDDEKIEDELYQIGWDAQSVYESLDDDLDDLDLDLDDLGADLDIDDEELDKFYEKKYRELIKNFVEKYELKEFINCGYDSFEDWLEKSKTGTIENEIKKAIEVKDRECKYVEYAVKYLSNLFNMSREELLKVIHDAYESNSEDTVSTMLMKHLGYEGVDVTHLNHDAQGLSGLDNFGYGTVIYDLKPNTFKKVMEPREDKSKHYKNGESEIKVEEDLTKEQEAYFKDSKIRDEKGNLLVCYHGTENPGFKEFDARKGKSQFGDYKFNDYNVNYFTTNKETAIGYTEIGIEENGNVYACYLNIVNPYIVNNKTEDDMYRSWQNIRDDKIREKEILYFERFYSKWSSRDISEKDLDELNRDIYFFNCAFKPNEEDDEYFDLVDLGSNTMFGASHPKMYAYSLNDFFDEDNYEEFRDSLVGDYEHDKDDFLYTIDNLIKWVLLMNEEDGTNYDGIIVPDITDIGPKGSPFMTGKTTDIITLKSSNQIKRIDNLKPTSSSRIDEMQGKGNISNNLILTYIEECIKTLKPFSWDTPMDYLYITYDDIDLEEGDTTRTFGTMYLPKYQGGNFKLVLNKHMFDEPEEAIKNTIYHELCHYIVDKIAIEKGIIYMKNGHWYINSNNYYANDYKGHGKKWQEVAAKVGRITGQDITRTNSYDLHTGVGAHAQDKYKYIVKCKHCGNEFKYMKRTDFVDEVINGRGHSKNYWCRCKDGTKSQDFEIVKGN